MGNASVSRRDETSPSQARSGEEEVGEDYMEYAHVNYHAPQPFQDSVLQSSVYSPRAYHSPLLFTPQVSVTPLQRPDVNQFQINTTKQNANLSDKRKPTIITWRNEGNEVAIEGSWDNWKTREFLQRSDKDLTIVKVLPIGVYYYQFIVDGCRMCASDLPRERDNMGNVFNVLDLQDHISEIENTSDSESESSPLSSYNNEYFSLEDFNEKVPEMPSILQRTPLNQSQSSSDGPQSLEKPLPSILNHLYIHKPSRGEHMTALSSTQRFRKKYVTVVLYKSLQNL